MTHSQCTLFKVSQIVHGLGMTFPILGHVNQPEYLNISALTKTLFFIFEMDMLGVPLITSESLNGDEGSGFSKSAV